MEKSADAFRTISEVAETLDLPQHVLRFWETRFPQIKPMKRGGGRRYYRPDDVELLRAIRQLLYAEGYTIKGVQRILKERGVRAVVALQAQRSAAGDSADLAPPAFYDEAEAQDLAAFAGMDTHESDGPGEGDETAVLDHPDPAHGFAHAPHEPPTPRAMAGPISAPLVDRELEQRLQAALFELAECERILASARRSV
jgi:DNA-binding transcriptional MerR regulator